MATRPQPCHLPSQRMSWRGNADPSPTRPGRQSNLVTGPWPYRGAETKPGGSNQLHIRDRWGVTPRCSQDNDGGGNGSAECTRRDVAQPHQSTGVATPWPNDGLSWLSPGDTAVPYNQGRDKGKSPHLYRVQRDSQE